MTITVPRYNPESVRVLRYRDCLDSIGGPSSPASTVIGTYVLDEDEEFTIGYEVAAWSTTIVVPAGSYEVTTNGYYGFVRLEGECVSSYTQSLFGGVPVGTQPQGEQHRDVGQTFVKCISPYLYDVAASFADPDNTRWVPSPHVEPVLRGWCEHIWSDRRYASAMWGLVVHDV